MSISEEGRIYSETRQEAYKKFEHNFEKVAKKLENLGSELINASKDKSELADLSKAKEKAKTQESVKEGQKVETQFDKSNKTAETNKENAESKRIVDSWNKEFDTIINSLKESFQTVKDEKVSQNNASGPKKTSTKEADKKFTSKIKEESDNKKPTSHKSKPIREL